MALNHLHRSSVYTLAEHHVPNKCIEVLGLVHFTNKAKYLSL
jgi:hypothetical protein